MWQAEGVIHMWSKSPLSHLLGAHEQKYERPPLFCHCLFKPHKVYDLAQRDLNSLLGTVLFWYLGLFAAPRAASESENSVNLKPWSCFAPPFALTKHCEALSGLTHLCDMTLRQFLELIHFTQPNPRFCLNLPHTLLLVAVWENTRILWTLIPGHVCMASTKCANPKQKQSRGHKQSCPHSAFVVTFQGIMSCTLKYQYCPYNSQSIQDVAVFQVAAEVSSVTDDSLMIDSLFSFLPGSITVFSTACIWWKMLLWLHHRW